MRGNNQIVQKSTISTNTVTAGLLNPEQSKKFIKQAMENTALGGLVRVEMRRAKTGELDKIGITQRQTRKKTENHDDNHRGSPVFSKVEYSTVAVRLPWEITEETLRENIEGQGLEATITQLMTQSVGIDQEDLWLNADTATPTTDVDYDFLIVKDGWIKQLLNSAHVVDRATVDSGNVTLDVWHKALLNMPNKYNNGKLRWLMSPHRKQAWETYLLEKAITTGGIISDKRIENPYAIPAIEVPSMPDDKVILIDPKNLVVVHTYEVKIRKTTEGKEAIMEDKRFYVIHFDYDSIIEEMDAAVIVTGLAPIL